MEVVNILLLGILFVFAIHSECLVYYKQLKTDFEAQRQRKNKKRHLRAVVKRRSK